MADQNTYRITDALWVKIFKARGIRPTKEWAENERRLCALNPIYFINNYCLVRNRAEDVGALPPGTVMYGDMIDLKLFEIQKTFLQSIKENQNTVTCKTRQSGISTTTGLFLLHQTTFKTNKEYIVISKSEQEAIKFLGEVQTAYMFLPFFLRRPYKIMNKKKMELGNKFSYSSIKALTSGKGSGRSFVATILVMDEAAFIQDAESIWAASAPTLTTTGGKAIIISTPWEDRGLFYDLVKGARAKRNVFNCVDIPWKTIPGRDAQWYARECAKLNHIQTLIKTELDMEFITRGTLFFDKTRLDQLPETDLSASINQGELDVDHVSDPGKFNAFEEQVHLPTNCWCNIVDFYDPEGSYVVCHDPKDDGQSSQNGIAVIRIDGFPKVPPQLVFELLTPNIVFSTLVDLSRYFGDCPVVVEKNRGFAVAQHFIGEGEEERLFKRPNGDIGILTNTATREMLLKVIAKFVSVDSESLTPILKYESGSFKRDTRGKLKGALGDDLIFALGVGLLALTLFPDLLGVDGGEDGRLALLAGIRNLGEGNRKMPAKTLDRYLGRLRDSLGAMTPPGTRETSTGTNKRPHALPV